MNKVINFGYYTVGILLEFFQYIWSQIQLRLFYQKWRVTNFLSDYDFVNLEKPKLLVAITHVTSTEESKCAEKGKEKTDKLTQTIEGIFRSFSGCELKILINTITDRHITQFLPDYQKNKIEVIEQVEIDPMLVGFRSQDEFIKREEQFDWFLYLEDDIIIYDSTFLNKIQCFNANSGSLKKILLPHRYEMLEGKKTYIDFSYDPSDNTAFMNWNKLSILEIGELKFCEFGNPHAGLYCLSKEQLKIWRKSGRFWKEKDIMVGPLESAATCCLFECFSLYKPHPCNLQFLEVQHWDTKYSLAMKTLSWKSDTRG
ncbi:hypothetical protein PJF56_11330 [Roseofilum sp. BLCC_M91]|uniref:Glycosyltransferase family 2 protein n=1 Tax=Roseofilum halophilum BLCC-M91 TaxID=3022259 RepID=A0ABT7BJU4_9CYAN|nr:hypothetical protein [Roseofilum halophilum]MDJ1179455.1 hypothetical protein [Roseofilum halophilum BLCC-M91]